MSRMTSSAVSPAAASGQAPPEHIFTYATTTHFIGKKNIKDKSVSTGEMAAQVDVRNCTHGERMVLSKGPLITVQSGDSCTKTIPLYLFRATSTTPELLKNGLVQLDAKLDSNSMHLFLNYMTTLTWSKKDNLKMHSHHLDLSTMLSVSAVSKALGMDFYTEHIYRACEYQLRNNMPSYDVLNQLLTLQTYHDRLLRIVAKDNLAIHAINGTIPDAEDFEEYLKGVPELAKYISIGIKAHKAR